MDDIVMTKGQNNVFFPATEADAEKVKKYKLGRGVRLKVTQMSEHNYLFHKKCFALLDLCYDHFAGQVDVGTEYRGKKVVPSKDLFKDEMTILAGYYDAIYSLNGKFRLQAKSWSYNKMTDDDKAKLFSSLINTALKHVYRGNMPEAELRNTVDQILAFDR